ncbi:hypothetical protein [Nostoc sp.]
MVTEFDHNLVMARIPFPKVTLRRSLGLLNVYVILNICKFLLF